MSKRKDAEAIARLRSDLAAAKETERAVLACMQEWLKTFRKVVDITYDEETGTWVSKCPPLGLVSAGGTANLAAEALASAMRLTRAVQQQTIQRLERELAEMRENDRHAAIERDLRD